MIFTLSFFVTDRRLTTAKNAKEKLLNGAEFDLESLIENHKNTKEYRNAYFRLEVVDKYGNRALTRAYFLSELGL